VATHGPRAPVRSASTRPATMAEAAHLRMVSTTLKQATALTGRARQSVDASSAPGEKENVEGAAARVPVLAKDVSVAGQPQQRAGPFGSLYRRHGGFRVNTPLSHTLIWTYGTVPIC
jgi:hypothetical protein